MIIRPEQRNDLDGIHAVHAASFPAAGEARLVDALRAAGRLRVSLVAEEAGEIVGHVAFSPVKVDGTGDGLGLAPLAVLPGLRRSGIGDRLVREGLAACAPLDCGFVVVLGDPAYYGRFGFRSAATWNLRDAFGGGEAFQALEIRGGAIPASGGLARYAPEFDALDSDEAS